MLIFHKGDITEDMSRIEQSGDKGFLVEEITRPCGHGILCNSSASQIGDLASSAIF